jgi:hypothetical protein
MAAMESNARWVIGMKVVDRYADPILFRFERDMLDRDTVDVEISQHDWQAIGPFQSAGLLIDEYLKRYPEEAQRVGYRSLTACVFYALHLDRS